MGANLTNGQAGILPVALPGLPGRAARVAAGLALLVTITAVSGQVLTPKNANLDFPAVDPGLFTFYTDELTVGRGEACQSWSGGCSGVISYRFNNVRVEDGHLKWDSEVRSEVEPVAVFGEDTIGPGSPGNVYKSMKIYTHLNLDPFGVEMLGVWGNCGEGLDRGGSLVAPPVRSNSMAGFRGFGTRFCTRSTPRRGLLMGQTR